jgi:hypothetical protein
MNLDDLKITWNALEEKLEASATLSEQIVLTMIRRESQSTIAEIQRKMNKAALFFVGLLALFAAILAGNPFDYVQWLEYVPAVLYALVVMAALAVIWSLKRDLSKVTLTRSDLRAGLKQVISMKERYEITMGRVWRISLFAGFLLGLSLMVRNFDTWGLTRSLLIIAANAVTVLIMFVIARYIFRQLPDAQLTELNMHLAELEDLTQ